ncbi:hypothetical protein EJK55_2074 [Moraxella catarrhalis]|uniref:Uncharacterized protein n=1 Tax=Moraxella catarrhalis TaxID=480 RepID=A0ABY0BLZ4_MORCA|nr:hypothetical protein EJK48_1375 [Moraxella catarrhalis]RUO16582.1 hypothetical protein EJK55_2074 [Moraxella catarrhalis]RUO17365.1 hypothetical protein EJK54_2103 [Moraxella catarrhalis]
MVDSFGGFLSGFFHDNDRLNSYWARVIFGFGLISMIDGR